MDINKDKLTFIGSMNYVVQAYGPLDNEDGEVHIDQYQPRKNKIWSGAVPSDEARRDIEETIERMKIAIGQFQELLDGKREHVYYWQLENEDYK